METCALSRKVKKEKVQCPKCLHKYANLDNHLKCPGFPNSFIESRIRFVFRE